MKHLKTFATAFAGAAMLATTAGAAERGSDGQLNIIYWQAPSILNPYISGGTKDRDAASIILEPLANFNTKGEMVPVLAEAIPTAADDLKSITWKLKKGVIWSDGTPFKASDVVFTANYCLNPAGGCNSLAAFEGVSKVEALDDHTVKISFEKPKPWPYGPFVGVRVPILQEAQFKECTGAKAPECTEENFGPIGTGPFKIDVFKANDVVTYKMNEKYREAGKPRFSAIVMKGGGDAAAAARSVLETGEFDYAWNLQVEPEVLEQMVAAGKGKLITGFGTNVERLFLQQTDIRPEAGDNRGVYMDGKNKHPFLTDPAVRKALSMAIDRETLVIAGYGPIGKVTCNIVPNPPAFVSTANDSCMKQDIEGANKLLDDAGWKRGSDGVRAKDGVRLSVLYQTSTNSVRQGTQALVKQMWQQIGVETELRNISASVFFGGDPSSPDTIQKFFADIQMFTNGFSGTDPENYVGKWTCDQMPGPKSQWIGSNFQRYCDPEYDKLVKQLSKTAEIGERAKLVKQMNDMLIQSYTIIPLIHRGSVGAISNTLGSAEQNDWDSPLWNIEDWHRIKG